MTWRRELEDAKADGYTFLLDLTAVDEVGHSDDIRVLVRLLNPDSGTQRTIDTLTRRDEPHLPDVSDLWPGAGFLQRQACDAGSDCPSYASTSTNRTVPTGVVSRHPRSRGATSRPGRARSGIFTGEPCRNSPCLRATRS